MKEGIITSYTPVNFSVSLKNLNSKLKEMFALRRDCNSRIYVICNSFKTEGDCSKTDKKDHNDNFVLIP